MAKQPQKRQVAPQAGVKRAIALAGGGPAAGLHIGVLDALHNEGMKFDVWALSCIGAWVGIVYNQCEAGREVEETYDFFKNGVFRDDESYERFPINTVFGPDWFGTHRALMEFVSKPESYDHIWLPHKMMDAFRDTMSKMFDRGFGRKEKNWDPNKPADWMMLLDQLLSGRWFRQWDVGDINQWLLNDVMAVNPFVRYFTSLMYLSKVTGLSRLYYPDSEFIKGIKFDRLRDVKNNKPDKPHIFHNAWNLTRQELELFSNKPMVRTKEYKQRGEISAASLCACSALPFIEETVEIGGDTYCEGALVDTVNFRSLLEEHPDLDEIWVSRIVDSTQIREPKNLHDALANLCQLFAATVGEDDVKLFKYHVKHDAPVAGSRWTGTLVEIQVPSQIDFKWSHANLNAGRKQGKEAAEAAYSAYTKAGPQKAKDLRAARFINEKKEGIETYDRERMAKAIARAKGEGDHRPYLRKMDWWVAGTTGDQVQLVNGQYPSGAMPYLAYVARIPTVKQIYDQLLLVETL